jgi:ABC transport system ATP-binding/permease protein
MNYLKAINLTKSYTDKRLVDHIDFVIDKWQKIALVAKNGAGKSTLIKLITWEIDKTDWEIKLGKWIKLGVLHQECNFDMDKKTIDILFGDESNKTLEAIKSYEQILNENNFDQEKLNNILSKIDELNAWEYESKIKTIISKLQINNYLNQKISTLSGGEKKRVMLAKVLVDDPDILILDEPTNHLDLDMIEWLENYLSKSEITLFMVTHDRYFLERVCNNIWELDRWKIYTYAWNYEYFLDQKIEREKNEAIEIRNLRKLMKQELAWIKKAPRWRQTKSTHREKRFYNIEEEYDSRKATVNKEKVEMEISMEERRLGWKILKINNLNKSFWNKKILKNFSHDFRHKERVGIIWKNGVWKSTFLNMIMWIENYDSGNIKSGETVTYWFYQQKDISFHPNKRVIDIVKDFSEFMYIKAGEKISATKLLERFLFPPEQQYIMAEKLSGWEKRRLYLLTILMKNPNFLILDEPTNDLDLMTLSVLEDFLLQYQWCLIVVSHDRFFMDRIVDHLFVFKWEWEVEDFWWTYSEHKESEKFKVKSEKKEEKITPPSSANSLPSNGRTCWEDIKKKKLSYMENREFEQLMNDIQKLEERKNDINNLFLDTNLANDDIKKLSKEISEIIRNIEIKETRWMELSERA